MKSPLNCETGWRAAEQLVARALDGTWKNARGETFAHYDVTLESGLTIQVKVPDLVGGNLVVKRAQIEDLHRHDKKPNADFFFLVDWDIFLGLPRIIGCVPRDWPWTSAGAYVKAYRDELLSLERFL